MIELYTRKEECCGCSACANVCHKHAIHMEQDEKGYLYPVIEKELCVECGLCEKVCPLKENKRENGFEKKAYGVKNIKIVDELFVLNEKHYMTIVELLIKRGYVFPQQEEKYRDEKF